MKGVTQEAKKRDQQARASVNAIKQKVKEHEKLSKSLMLKLRVDAELKDKFTSQCKENGTTPSAALRQFMRGYIEGAD